MINKDTPWEDNPDFLEFVDREFDKTAANATIQELAEFAFGSIQAAMQDYEHHNKGHTDGT